MKPYQCRSTADTEQMPEAGIGYNNEKITVQPPNVIIEIFPATSLVRISQRRFEQFARWYLGKEDDD